MRAVLGQLRAELILMSRRGENVLVTLVVPVTLLVFFGVAAPLSTLGATPGDILVPGILSLAIVSTSMVSLGIATAFERHYGVLKRLIGSPLPVSSLLLAKTLSVLLVECVQVVLVLGLGRLLLGWSPRGSLPLGLAVLLVGSLAFAGLGLLMAGTLRAEATLAVANGLYLVFLMLGGFVFPIERLPEPLQVVADVLPAAALTNTLRGVLEKGQVDSALPLLVLVAWAIAACGAAVATFKPE